MSSEGLKENPTNLTEAREYVAKLAVEAGERLRQFFTSGDFSSTQKEGLDFTTQADTEVDAFLRAGILKQFPNAQLLTEETAPSDYQSLKDVDNLWIIDPLDGTINFSRKDPNFAISVALVNRGNSRLSVVHIPMTGDTYWAQEDQEGAFLNGEPIHVSPTQNLREALVATDWGWVPEGRKKVVKWLGDLSPHVRQVKCLGSAVADLAKVAEGRIDAYLNSGLKPWDMAASSLLIQKAGGTVTTPESRKLDIFNYDILASNGLLHQKVLELIK